MIKSQSDKCAETDFLYDLGKHITLHPTMPADVAGNLYIQIRMITALAVMGGYDPHDDLIKTLVFIALVGMSTVDISKCIGTYIGNKITVQALKSCSKKMSQRDKRINRLQTCHGIVS